MNWGRRQANQNQHDHKTRSLKKKIKLQQASSENVIIIFCKLKYMERGDVNFFYMLLFLPDFG